MRDFIDRLLLQKSNNTLVQLIRYTFVGGTAFLVDAGLLWFFTEILHIYYLVSASLSFLVGVIVNYLISINWVFTQRRLQKPRLEFTIFAVIGIAGLGLNVLVIWFFTEIVGFHYMASKIISAFLVYLFNFFGRKILLFSK